MVPASPWETPTNVTVLRGSEVSTVRQVRQILNQLSCFTDKITQTRTYLDFILQMCSEAEDLLKCLYQNGQCQHFCDGSGVSHKCSCAHGHMLASDGRQCIAEGTTIIVTHFNQ